MHPPLDNLDALNFTINLWFGFKLAPLWINDASAFERCWSPFATLRNEEVAKYSNHCVTSQISKNHCITVSQNHSSSQILFKLSKQFISHPGPNSEFLKNNDGGKVVSDHKLLFKAHEQWGKQIFTWRCEHQGTQQGCIGILNGLQHQSRNDSTRRRLNPDKNGREDGTYCTVILAISMWPWFFILCNASFSPSVLSCTSLLFWGHNPADTRFVISASISERHIFFKIKLWGLKKGSKTSSPLSALLALTCTFLRRGHSPKNVQNAEHTNPGGNGNSKTHFSKPGDLSLFYRI